MLFGYFVPNLIERIAIDEKEFHLPYSVVGGTVQKVEPLNLCSLCLLNFSFKSAIL
jgi:hypothetical protein